MSKIYEKAKKTLRSFTHGSHYLTTITFSVASGFNPAVHHWTKTSTNQEINQRFLVVEVLSNQLNVGGARKVQRDCGLEKSM